MAVSVLSWVAGLLAYVSALAVFWQQSVSGGDLAAVLFWSALATTITVALVYAPVMFALLQRRTTELWKYVGAGVGLGIVPVLLINVSFGGRIRFLFSPEAALFYWMFGTFGVVFGIGFFLAYRKEPL